MRKIAILDDEQSYLDAVSALLTEYGRERSEQFTMEQFSNPFDFLDRLERGEEYDLCLFDIYMPGVTGMSVAVEMRKRTCATPIIFLTSSPDFALQAFGVNAIQYLLKPYRRDDFFEAMDKALHMIGVQQPKTILLKASDGYHNIVVNKIIYSESDNHNQRILILDSEPLYVRISSTELCEKLTPFAQFYPCGKAYIVNLERIDKLRADTVLMDNGDSLAIPRRVMTSLKNAYLDYLGRR